MAIDTTRTIELESPLTVTLFPVDPQNATNPLRHTVIRRWDQGGQVRKEDGTAYADLDAPGSTGDIPIPPAGTWVFLENGILAEFDLDPAGGEFRSGDYWVVWARAVIARIVVVDAQRCRLVELVDVRDDGPRPHDPVVP